MLKHWSKLLNTDCVVIGIGERLVYPIYVSGSTSLRRASDRSYTNEEINALDHIDIIIRNPNERFVSGINVYSSQNNITVPEVHHLVKEGNLVDRHIGPQYVWLCHLYRFFKGTVTLKPLDAISDYCDNHNHRNRSKTIVDTVAEFVDVDHRLLEQLGHTQKLQHIVERYKNVLS
mgnify:FL=1